MYLLVLTRCPEYSDICIYANVMVKKDLVKYTFAVYEIILLDTRRKRVRGTDNF